MLVDHKLLLFIIFFIIQWGELRLKKNKQVVEFNFHFSGVHQLFDKYICHAVD